VYQLDHLVAKGLRVGRFGFGHFGLFLSVRKCPRNGGNFRLTTGCFAPVDKTPHVPVRGTSPCPQAGPVDNPAMVIINENPETTRV
jgi:hypothetical protein